MNRFFPHSPTRHKTAIFSFAVIIHIVLAISPVTAEIIPKQAVSWTDFSHITCIAVSSDFAYFGTTEGILRYHRFDKKWYEPITVSDGLPGRTISRIAVPMDDDWIAVETENGIYNYQSGAQYWYLETEFPAQYAQDSRPQPPLPDLFMPFGYRMDPKGYFSDNFFRDWQITAFLDDQYNTIFIGTWGLGPLKSDIRDFQAELIPCGLLQKRTDAIYIEGDSIWLAGSQGQTQHQYRNARYGVTLYERSKQKFSYIEPRYIPGFDSEVIYDIAADEKNIYFAGRHGLTVHPRKGDHYFTLRRGDGLPDNQTTALAVAGDSVWIGTAHGVAFYNPSADTVLVIGKKTLGNLFVTSLELVEGKLIIGSTDGTFYIDARAKKVGRLKESESVNKSKGAKDPFGILEGEIRHLSVFGDMLYVSSNRGLIAVNLATEKIKPELQLNEPVYAAAANENYIAAAVEDGLILVERKSGKRREFTEEDGLLSVNINTIVPDGDYLWLGSDEGLTRFKWVNPERVD